MKRTRRWATTTLAAIAVIATAAACSSSGGSGSQTGSSSNASGSSGNSSSHSGKNTAPGASSGTITVAQQPNATINFILPFPDPAHLSPYNLPWYEMQYRPLYWFGQDGKPVLNDAKSLAEPPQWSADRKSITIKMKPWKWSNGDPITAQNVAFWINMAKANKDKLGIYSPGYIPDNISSFKITAPGTIVLNLDKAYNKDWFLFSQLSQVWVFPETWDKTATNTTAHCSTNISDCKAVYAYLDKEATDTKTYDSNPLWQNVSGPWKMEKFKTQGDITMVPNPNYSGPDKPKFKKYVMKAFTSSDAEYNVLQNGNVLDVGYIPFSAIKEPKPANSGSFGVGPNPVSKYYDMVATIGLYGPNNLMLNRNDPSMGAVFNQTYFRQALTATIDQDSIIKNLYKGYGYPNYGPVPLEPPSKWVPSVEKPANFPYKYNLDKAKKLLTDHGWKVNPGGSSVCENPGTGSNQCGAGIAKGKKLAFTYIYATGDVTTKTQVEYLKSTASKIGVNITLRSMNANLAQSVVVPCKPADCKWQASLGGWGYVYYPSGEQIYNTGAFANFDSINDPKVNQLITETHTSATNQAMLDYASYVSENTLDPWMPKQQTLMVFAKGLKGYLPEAHGAYSFPYASELYFEK